MRERAAQELNPEIGRMGAEDPARGFWPSLKGRVAFFSSF